MFLQFIILGSNYDRYGLIDSDDNINDENDAVDSESNCYEIPIAKINVIKDFKFKEFEMGFQRMLNPLKEKRKIEVSKHQLSRRSMHTHKGIGS